MLIYKTNMTPESLGELEQLVLLAIMRLGPDCYGVPIVDELQKHATRPILRPSVYLALRRLEEKGLIRGRMGEPEPRRGGRARRHFEITAAARHALTASQRTLNRRWDGVALGKTRR
jgi:DNA-binding PadR family transcriptional regulator